MLQGWQFRSDLYLMNTWCVQNVWHLSLSTQRSLTFDVDTMTTRTHGTATTAPQPQRKGKPRPSVFDRFLEAQRWTGARTPVTPSGVAFRLALLKQQQGREANQITLRQLPVHTKSSGAWMFRPGGTERCDRCGRDEVRRAAPRQLPPCWGTWVNNRCRNAHGGNRVLCGSCFQLALLSRAQTKK